MIKNNIQVVINVTDNLKIQKRKRGTRDIIDQTTLGEFARVAAPTPAVYLLGLERFIDEAVRKEQERQRDKAIVDVYMNIGGAFLYDEVENNDE